VGDNCTLAVSVLSCKRKGEVKSFIELRGGTEEEGVGGYERR